jgi:hypothetical protein
MKGMATHRGWPLLLLLAGLVPEAATADDLKPFSASYAINWHGLSATSRVELERLADGRWSYSSETATPRLIPHSWLPGEVLPRRSVFRFQNEQLIPETFTVDDGTSNDSKDQHIVFDWSAGRVLGTAERKPVDLPTQPGLLDELSIHVALMHALLMGHTPDHFIIVDGNRVKDYMYTAQGKERLTTSVGEYDTLIFRSSREGSRKTTWFWCAPELGYLPLKVEGRDGRSVEMTMRVQQVTR